MSGRQCQAQGHTLAGALPEAHEQENEGTQTMTGRTAMGTRTSGRSLGRAGRGSYFLTVNAPQSTFHVSLMLIKRLNFILLVSPTGLLSGKTKFNCFYASTSRHLL